MLTHTAQDITSNQVARIPAELLDGFRFRVCETEPDATRAIAVRRHVYRDSCGYSVPVPDDIDARSWLLLAEETETGRAVGTVRITPRFAGPLELEEYVQLPTRLETPGTIEITRLAILPEYRKTNMLVPAVSFGLFRLTYEFAMQLGAKAEVVCAKPERVMSYVLMGFRPTGRSAPHEITARATSSLAHTAMCRIWSRTMFRLSSARAPQVPTPRGEAWVSPSPDATSGLAACAYLSPRPSRRRRRGPSASRSARAARGPMRVAPFTAAELGRRPGRAPAVPAAVPGGSAARRHLDVVDAGSPAAGSSGVAAKGALIDDDHGRGVSVPMHVVRKPEGRRQVAASAGDGHPWRPR
jgi:hypothetical protein